MPQHNTLDRQLAVRENYGALGAGRSSGAAVALLDPGDIPDPQRKLARARDMAL
jgi:hypothetical protein